MVVATKYMPLPWRLRQPQSLLAALRASLLRLGLERVDLYQIHTPCWFTCFNSLEVRLVACLGRACGVR